MARRAQASDGLSFVSAVFMASFSVVSISDNLTLPYLSVEWSPLCQREGEGKRGKMREGGGGGGRKGYGFCVVFLGLLIIHTGNAITTNYSRLSGLPCVRRRERGRRGVGEWGGICFFSPSGSNYSYRKCKLLYQ